MLLTLLLPWCLCCCGLEKLSLKQSLCITAFTDLDLQCHEELHSGSWLQSIDQSLCLSCLWDHSVPHYQLENERGKGTVNVGEKWEGRVIRFILINMNKMYALMSTNKWCGKRSIHIQEINDLDCKAIASNYSLEILRKIQLLLHCTSV